MPGGMTPEYREAVRRLQARKHFRVHATVYAAAMLILWGINAWFWEGYAWVLWPALAWGVGLVFHAAAAWSRRGSKLDEGHIRQILQTLKK